MPVGRLFAHGIVRRVRPEEGHFERHAGEIFRCQVAYREAMRRSPGDAKRAFHRIGAAGKYPWTKNKPDNFQGDTDMREQTARAYSLLCFLFSMLLLCG